MPNYRRNFVAGGCYFFTVNLLERQRTLLTDHIDLLRDSVRRAVGWVEHSETQLSMSAMLGFIAFNLVL